MAGGTVLVILGLLLVIHNFGGVDASRDNSLGGLVDSNSVWISYTQQTLALYFSTNFGSELEENAAHVSDSSDQDRDATSSFEDNGTSSEENRRFQRHFHFYA